MIGSAIGLFGGINIKGPNFAEAVAAAGKGGQMLEREGEIIPSLVLLKPIPRIENRMPLIQMLNNVVTLHGEEIGGLYVRHGEQVCIALNWCPEGDMLAETIQKMRIVETVAASYYGLVEDRKRETRRQRAAARRHGRRR